MVAFWGLLTGTTLLWVVFELNGSRAQSPRCPRCRYNMSQAVSLTCPECGRNVPNSKALKSTLRRPWRIVLALISALIAGIGLVVVISERSWIELLPSQILVRVAPLDEPASTLTEYKLYKELLDRAHTINGLQFGSRNSLLRRMLDQGVEDGTLIMSRKRWPKAVPIRVGISWSPWLASEQELELTIADRSGDSLYVQEILDPVGEMHEPFHPWTDSTTRISASAVSDGEIALDVQIKDKKRTIIAHEQLRRPLKLVDRIDDAITPVDSVALENALKNNLKMGIWDLSERLDVPNSLFLRIDRPQASILSNVALGLKVAFLHDGKEIASADFYFSDVRGLPITEPSWWLPVPIEGDLAALTSADKSDPLWSVRISGDGELALRDFDRNSYWSGTIVLPLSALTFEQYDFY